METAVERSVRKQREGKVVSAKTAKTVMVQVDRRVRHPVYGKAMSRSARFMVHDERGEARVGDVVRIVETRPISKRKRWRVLEVVRRAAAVPAAGGGEAS